MIEQILQEEARGVSRPALSIETADPPFKDIGATSDAGFYATWLRLQCGFIEATVGMLVLRQGGSKTYAAVAAWPVGVGDTGRLAEVAQQCLGRNEIVILDELVASAGPGLPRKRALFAHPIGVAEQDLPVAAVVVAVEGDAISVADRDRIARHLHWGSGWIEAMEWRRLADRGTGPEAGLGPMLDFVAVAGEHRRLVASALAVANEFASRFDCSRVSIGTVSRSTLKLTAMSHSATFDGRSQFARSIESAMEEALHQNRTIAQPPLVDGDRAITIAHRQLAKTSGSASIVSCVLPGRTAVVGVVTLERTIETPFAIEDVRRVETVVGLLGPLFELQIEGERWITGRGRTLLATHLAKLTGPDHPTFKLLVAAAIALPLILLLVPGTFRVSAKSVVEGQIQRTLVVPYDGFIRDAPARAGDTVKRGQVLARLDDRDAQLERARWLSETQTIRAKYDDAMARHDRPNLMMDAAQLRQAEAQLALAEDKLARTDIVAPFDGVLVTGDLSQVLGSPVERGKTLYEIAPLDRFRVIVQVDERDIRFVRPSQRGRLVLAGMPADPIALRVTKVMPLATSEEGRTFFRVEAALDSPETRLRPGMEGISRVDVGRRPLLWIWTRSLIDWVRIALWRWLP